MAQLVWIPRYDVDKAVRELYRIASEHDESWDDGLLDKFAGIAAGIQLEPEGIRVMGLWERKSMV